MSWLCRTFTRTHTRAQRFDWALNIIPCEWCRPFRCSFTVFAQCITQFTCFMNWTVASLASLQQHLFRSKASFRLCVCVLRACKWVSVGSSHFDDEQRTRTFSTAVYVINRIIVCLHIRLAFLPIPLSICSIFYGSSSAWRCHVVVLWPLVHGSMLKMRKSFRLRPSTVCDTRHRSRHPILTRCCQKSNPFRYRVHCAVGNGVHTHTHTYTFRNFCFLYSKKSNWWPKMIMKFSPIKRQRPLN